MIGLGVFFLVVIMSWFVITHMIVTQGDVDSMSLAAELAVILFSGFMIFFALYFLTSLL